MNVEFEPSSSHIKVNELMNVTPNASVSISPYVHKHLRYMCSVCAFVYFRGRFIIQSCMPSLDDVGMAGHDQELFVGAFLLMFIALCVSLL